MRHGRLPWAVLLLALAVGCATLPFYAAGHRVRVLLLEQFAASGADAPWGVTVARYAVGIYRSAFDGVLHVAGPPGSALQLPFSGTVEHGLLATRIAAQARAGGRGADPLPVTLDLLLRHRLPWQAAAALDGRITLDAVDGAAVAPGTALTSDALAARLECARGRCQAQGGSRRLVLDAGREGRLEVDGLTARLEAVPGSLPRGGLASEVRLAGLRLHLPGLRLAVEDVTLAAEFTPAAPFPVLSLSVARATHPGLPYVRLAALAMHGAPETVRGAPVWRIQGTSGSNFGALAWQASVIPETAAGGRGSLEFEGHLPGGLLELLAQRLGMPLEELERAGWVAQDGQRYRLGVVRRFGRWLPGLAADRGS